MKKNMHTWLVACLYCDCDSHARVAWMLFVRCSELPSSGHLLRPGILNACEWQMHDF